VSGPATAGVNSFGVGGANAHVLLEQPPAREFKATEEKRPKAQILTISARNARALQELAQSYVDFFQHDKTVCLHDVCYTASVRRSHHEHRLATVTSSPENLVHELGAFVSGKEVRSAVSRRCFKNKQPKLAFAFAGMGPQWWGMGRQLMHEEPLFRHVLEECDQLLRPLSKWSLMDELTADETNSRVGDADVTQVANCAIQIALTALWKSWGIIPDAVVGHSAGEMAAAHAAGVLSMSDALRVAFHRGRLLHRATGKGTMLALGMSHSQAASAIRGYENCVSIAAINSPTSVTLSGDAEALQEIAQNVEQQQLFCRFLPTRVPYHSPQIDSSRGELLESLAGLDPHESTIPIVSEVTGSFASGRAFDGSYWWRNAREPVQFAAAIDQLIEAGYELFLEISPHPVLATYISECLGSRGKDGTVLPTVRRREDERETMLRSLATLYVHGREVRWPGVYQYGICVSLPQYPWQRERHWLDLSTSAGAPTPNSDHPLLGRRLRTVHPSWEKELDDALLAYLDDHVIHDTPVYPAAAYVETALAVLREIANTHQTAVQQIALHKMLPMQRRDTLALQLIYHPDDTSFEIYSATNGENPTWTLHASGKLGHGGRDEACSVDLQAIMTRCAAEIPAAECYRTFEEFGVRFANAFCGIAKLWRGENEALGRIELPAGIELSEDRYQIHPALLDAAFQVLIGAIRPVEGLYLPTLLEGVKLHHRPGRRFWSHVRIRQHNTTQVEAALELIDDAGNIALSIETLCCQLIEKHQPSEINKIDDWLYELPWEENDLQVAPLQQFNLNITPRQIAETMEPTLDRLSRDWNSTDYARTVEPKLNAIVLRFIAAAFAKLGWNPDDGASSFVELPESLGIAHQRRRLFARLTEIFREGSRYVDSTPVELVCERVQSEHPDCRVLVEMLKRCGARLAEVLRGEVDPREILFTPDALTAWSQFFSELPWYCFYNSIVAEAIAIVAQSVPRNTKLRILEIGAGTGGTTSFVLSRLPLGEVEYLVTDISPFFLAHARQQFGNNSNVRFSALNIERDPAAQLEQQTFDVILAANVLHATADLRVALRNMKRLLSPGGIAVLLEGTRKMACTDLIFGVTEGWWRFRDLDLRPTHPLLNEQQWRTLLNEVGFENVESISGTKGQEGADQAVVIGRAPNLQTAEKNWLIFADAKGVGEKIAGVLRNRGDSCTVVSSANQYRRPEGLVFEISPTSTDDISRLLDEIGSGFDGVIHCWSIDAPLPDRVTTFELMNFQQVACGSVLSLIQNCEKRGLVIPAIWLITAGSQLPDHEKEPPNVSEAPLWGLGRVVTNEQAALRCRIVDLSTTPSIEEIQSLVVEIHGDDVEEELAFRGSKRFVRRLRRTSIRMHGNPPEERELSPESSAFGVEITSPGSLETLILREKEIGIPGPDEISIRVMASGINFRDVMLALGMLPLKFFDAVGGRPPLGWECSGIVTSCGPNVVAFRPGDEVIAVATDTLGSQVKTWAGFAVKKPPHLSHEQAATMPIAFLTAHYALDHLAKLRAGERVLIHAASGGVGTAAIQVAKRAGAEIFATAGNDEKRAYLKCLGVHHVMNSRSLAFADEILQLTKGDGIDVILNSLAGEAIPKGLSLLRPCGRFIEIGKRDIYQNSPLGLLPFEKNLAFFSVALDLLFNQRPGLISSMLHDIVEEVSQKNLQPLPYTGFDLAEAEQALRFIAQAKHIGKVLLTVRAPQYRVSCHSEPELLRSNATYLITGGLGGFGLAVADWMAKQGAGNIVLMSRKGEPAKENEAALRKLRQSAATVTVFAGDVSQENDVARILDFIQKQLPPLKGVVHAAMVLDDAPLLRITPERLQSVLAPKVAGAWNLHKLTSGNALDLFILFSSITSVFGTAGQGNYAAANAFLDALAEYRRALGLPGLSINWGTLSEVGYVSSREDVRRYLARQGVQGFTTEEALSALDALLRHNFSQAVAARIDWNTWSSVDPALAAIRKSQRLSHFYQVEKQPEFLKRSEEPESMLAALRGIESQDRPSWLENYIIQKTAKVLGSSPDKVDAESPLTQMGFDSLMAVELQTNLKRTFGVALPVVRLLEGIGIRQLAKAILEQLALDGSSPASTSEQPQNLPREQAVECPLSFEQRRLWFLDQLQPGNPAYNVPAAVRLCGRLNRRALEESLNELVRRHEALRATIRAAGGQPVQVISQTFAVTLPMVDLRHLPQAERETEALRLANEERQKSFDLMRGPLLRTTLLQLDEQEHVILLTIHHIIVDAWSMAVIVKEVAALYAAFSAGLDSPLSEPAIRYTDFIRRQHEMIQGELVQTQIAYWNRRLANAPSVLKLPWDYPRPPAQTFRGASDSFELSETLSDGLQELSRREGVTLFMTLVAAFQILLHRYSGQDDISVGTPVANRNRAEVDGLIGCFVNSVVIRTNLAGNPTFRELLGRVREIALEAYAHQDVPFESVVEAVDPLRDPSQTPLFQVMFVLHNVPMPAIELTGLKLTPLDVESGTATFDLTLVMQVGEKLRASVEYNTDLFEAATIRRMIGHFINLLEGITSNPGQRISHLPLLSESERRQMLMEWNDTRTAYDGSCIHQLFELQVERRPTAIAAVFKNQHLTYQQLNERSNRLATRLRNLGIGPGVCAGICVERSLEMIIGLLGILKAGGAYIPLDPTYPKDRLQFILHDAQPPALLTQQRFLKKLTPARASVICLDADQDCIAEEPLEKLTNRATPDDLAYIMYTSGSTGSPKGVMISHRAICNQILWRQTAFPLSDSDAVLQRTSISFDPSVWELFAALATGARLIIAPPDERFDCVSLVNLIVECGVTTLQVVPSMLQALLETPGFGDCCSLKRVFCGGEVLPLKLQQCFFEVFENVDLISLYGPTEASIDASFWKCKRNGERGRAFIGRPIGNVRLYILDTHLQPVPIGVAGELHIGGTGLARGYLHDTNSTAEKFTPDPFNGSHVGRIYKTGDMARYTPNGDIEFLGRLDDQVKIRGCRVEPGEIEAVLSGYAGVRQAIVVTQENTSGEKYLIGYVVAENENTVDGSDLRRFLQDKLPGYMVPASVVVLEKLPVMPNGKLDRLALTISHDRGNSDNEPVKPRDSLELQLVRIWENALNVRPIGITDNFFEIGGHSLMAVRLMAQIKEAFGYAYPLPEFFQRPTIDDVARTLRGQTKAYSATGPS